MLNYKYLNYLIYAIIIICLYSNSYCQSYFYVNNAKFHITANTFINAKCNLQIEGLNSNLIQDSSNLYITGNFTVTGNFTSNESNTHFTGSLDSQMISGNNVHFYNFIMNKTSSDYILIPNCNITINNNAVLYNGKLSINNIYFLIKNDLYNNNQSILENNADFPNAFKVEGNVINDAELNNNGWFEIGVE